MITTLFQFAETSKTVSVRIQKPKVVSVYGQIVHADSYTIYSQWRQSPFLRWIDKRPALITKDAKPYCGDLTSQIISIYDHNIDWTLHETC